MWIGGGGYHHAGDAPNPGNMLQALDLKRIRNASKP
jgi:hypothetical protein